jgi:dihydrofolate synthase/folylpolyglutamate synthase
VLKKALRSGFPRRRLIVILGVMSDKEIRKMMADLIPLAELLILTRPRTDRAASLETLRPLASSFQKPMAEVAEVREALRRAMAEAGEEDLILVTGSLYTVGEARAYLTNSGKVLS